MERDALQLDRRGPQIRSRLVAPGDRAVPADLDQVEQPPGDRGAVRARVELRGEVADRKVELGREHEHRQARLKPESSVDEPHADRHGDERHTDRRGELEHRAGEEGDTQRAERGDPVPVADRLDLLGLRLRRG